MADASGVVRSGMGIDRYIYLSHHPGPFAPLSLIMSLVNGLQFGSLDVLTTAFGATALESNITVGWYVVDARWACAPQEWWHLQVGKGFSLAALFLH